MIVVDASVILHVLIEPAIEPHVLEAVESSESLIAPHLIDIEVLNGIRKKLLSKILTAKRANDAVHDLELLKLNRHSLAGFNARLWHFRHNITPYDAAYIVLAEAYRCPLLTRDARLKSAAPSTVQVELL